MPVTVGVPVPVPGRSPARPARARVLPLLGRTALALAGVVAATYLLAVPRTPGAVPGVPVTDASWQATVAPSLPGGPGPVPQSAVPPSVLQRALEQAASTEALAKTPPSPSRPPWWTPVIGAAAQKSGLPGALVAAVVQVESEGNPGAVSPAGAKGLMQLLPATAAALGVRDIFDPLDNASGGARYLRQWLLDYARGDTGCVAAPASCPTALQLALAAYNAGPNAVRRYGGVPPYPETQRYIREVLGLYADYSAEG